MVSGLSRMCSCKNGKYFLSAWWLMLRCHWARPHPPAEVAQHYLHASFNLNRCLHACMRDYRQLELIKLTNIQWLACIVCIAQYSIQAHIHQATDIQVPEVFVLHFYVSPSLQALGAIWSLDKLGLVQLWLNKINLDSNLLTALGVMHDKSNAPG